MSPTWKIVHSLLLIMIIPNHKILEIKSFSSLLPSFVVFHVSNNYKDIYRNINDLYPIFYPPLLSGGYSIGYPLADTQSDIRWRTLNRISAGGYSIGYPPADIRSVIRKGYSRISAMGWRQIWKRIFAYPPGEKKRLISNSGRIYFHPLGGYIFFPVGYSIMFDVG